jgi:hypothetical protein
MPGLLSTIPPAYISEESRGSSIAQPKIPQAPIILHRCHLRVMVIRRRIRRSARRSRDDIAQENGEDLVCRATGLAFVESWTAS